MPGTDALFVVANLWFIGSFFPKRRGDGFLMWIIGAVIALSLRFAS